MEYFGQDNFLQLASKLITNAELKNMKTGGFGTRMGFGQSPALLIVDAQNYMVGPTDENDKTQYPSACPTARKTVAVIARLAEAFRAGKRPVFYTRNVARPDGRDMGVKALKRRMLHIEGWYLEGTKGAEIAPALTPKDEDVVLMKRKQSAFHGTPLLGLLLFAGIDTLVIAGGSTSNCIRATAIDSSTHNFRTIVPADAVFDRIQISHVVNLMDIDRQLGDVVGSGEVISYLSSLPHQESTEAANPIRR